MPVDPQVQEFLDQYAKSGLMPMDVLTPKEARAQLLAGVADLGTPEEVDSVSNHAIPGPVGVVPIRIFHPKFPPDVEAKRPLPLIVFFHGGGWVVGSIDTHDGMCRSLANACGAVVVGVDYRLAPEQKFPAALDDCFCATLWAGENAATLLGCDPGRLIVAGDSAGGNLAAAVALEARNHAEPKIAHQLLIYPALDCRFDTKSYLENAEGYYLTKAQMEYFWQQYLESEDHALNPYACPLRAAELENLPPATIITAEYDPLRDEGEAYAKRLRQAGVKAVVKQYDGMIHGFLRRTNMFSAARQCLEDIAVELAALPRTELPA